MAVPVVRSISAHYHRVPVFDTPVKMKKSRRDGTDAAATMPTRALGSGSPRLVVDRKAPGSDMAPGSSRLAEVSTMRLPEAKMQNTAAIHHQVASYPECSKLRYLWSGGISTASWCGPAPAGQCDRALDVAELRELPPVPAVPALGRRAR
jgi:hypothetical protein